MIQETLLLFESANQVGVLFSSVRFKLNKVICHALSLAVYTEYLNYDYCQITTGRLKKRSIISKVSNSSTLRLDNYEK